MTDLQRTFDALTRWFAERGLSTDSLTVILNIADRDTAARFDEAIQRDLEAVLLRTRGQDLDVRAFQILGVKVRVESPVHTP